MEGSNGHGRSVTKQRANEIVSQLMEEAGIDPGDVMGVQFFPDRMTVLVAQRTGAGMVIPTLPGRGIQTKEVEVHFT